MKQNEIINIIHLYLQLMLDLFFRQFLVLVSEL